MNLEGRRPLLLAIAGATALSLGGLLWLSRSLWVAGTAADSSPGSLFDLLEDSKGATGTRTERLRPAPPPTLEPWVSPLRQACPLRDPALERRLKGLMVGLPRQRQRIRIDSSNYGQRFRRDVYGNPIDPTPRLVVLHETVYGLESAINTFRTHHPDDNDQVSYHTLIGGKGQVIDTLDPSRRAFGAGFSAFNGAWVFTSSKVGGSINNFALHISLETPIDGENDGPGHSGYSPAQYDALAVVLADWMRRYPIRPEAITTHRHVDLGQERSDPRSFNWSELQRRLAALRLIC
jgi:N-acetyl-anhydromuramyl-L-alanine amidase AmpD